MVINQIIEGWRNKLVPPEKLSGIIESISKERNSICRSCEHHSMFHKTLRFDDHCTYCGCTLSAKTCCLTCKCPLDTPKWESINLKTTENEKE